MSKEWRWAGWVETMINALGDDDHINGSDVQLIDMRYGESELTGEVTVSLRMALLPFSEHL